MANTQRNVDIVVRARDETQRALRTAQTALERFAQAQARTAARRSFLDGQRQAAEQTGRAYFEAARAAQELGRQTRGGTAGTRAQRQAFQEARQAARDAAQAFRESGVAFLQATGRAGTGQGAFSALDAAAAGQASATAAAAEGVADAQQQAAAATQQHANAARRLEAALEIEARLAREVDTAQANLWSTQRQASASTEELTRAKIRLADAQQRLAAASRNVIALQAAEIPQSADLAQRTANAFGSRQGRGPLGLRPYELTNLGYQINDLITQVASGTSPIQALAQQGGQLIQIFPQAAVTILRLVPAIAAVTAVVAPFIGAFARVTGLNRDLRAFERQLSASADASIYNAEQLAKSAQGLRDMGFSSEQARASIKAFTDDSLNPALFETFGRAARQVARITGRELPEASQLLSDGLTGNYEDFRRLDEQLNVVTLAERRRIRELFEAGKAEEARRLALQLTLRALGEAQQSSDRTARAGENLGRAWNNMLDAIGNWPVIQQAIRFIDNLSRRIAYLTSLLPGATEAGRTADRNARIRQLEAQLQTALQRRSASDNLPAGSRRRTSEELDRDIASLRAQIADLREGQARDGLAAAATALGTTTGGVGAAAAAQSNGVVLASEREAKAAEDAALRDGERAARDAERRAEQQREFVAGLAAENAERLFQISLLDETERQQQILTALRKAEQEAADVGLSLTAAQRREIEATTGALYDAQIALKATETIERARLDLAKRRGEVETEAAFIARTLAEEAVGWTQEQTAAYTDLLRQIYAVDEQTRQRTEAEKQVNDLMAVRSTLLEQIEAYENAGQMGVAGLLRDQLVGVNEQLTFAVDHAINLISAFGGEGAQAALLNLGLIRDQLRGLGEDTIVTGKQINEMLAQGGANAFDQFAQAVAEGQNVITSLRDAFLQFAADFLRQIAQMITQQLLLNAISGIFGGGAGGGGGGGIGGFLARGVNAAGAATFHTGGIVGLRPDEVPIIAQRGEEVLTAADPRHRNNGGLTGGSPSVTNVNVFDPADFLDRALAGDGGRILINWVGRNASEVKTVLG